MLYIIYHIISYHIVSYRIISYHIILYYISFYFIGIWLHVSTTSGHPLATKIYKTEITIAKPTSLGPLWLVMLMQFQLYMFSHP